MLLDSASSVGRPTVTVLSLRLLVIAMSSWECGVCVGRLCNSLVLDTANSGSDGRRSTTRLLVLAMSSWECRLCVEVLLDDASSVERPTVGVLSLRLACSGKKRSTGVEDPLKMQFLKFDEKV